MKRTNTKAFKAILRDYLADSITDYDGNEFDNQNAAFAHAKMRFESEYNYPQNKRRIPNDQARVAEWLAGCAINIAFENWMIIRDAERMHECSLTDKQADRVVENWFNFMAFHLIRNW